MPLQQNNGIINWGVTARQSSPDQGCQDLGHRM